MDEIRRLWEGFNVTIAHLRTHPPAVIVQAEADYKAGVKLERSAWNDRLSYFRGINALSSAGSYPNRTKCIIQFCERWGLQVPMSSGAAAGPAAAPSRAPGQLLLF